MLFFKKIIFFVACTALAFKDPLCGVQEAFTSDEQAIPHETSILSTERANDIVEFIVSTIQARSSEKKKRMPTLRRRK